MGSNSYNTTDLINDVLLLGHVPLGNNTFDNPKILRLADMEMKTPIAKQILSTRGGYYLTYVDLPLASDGLYQIPSDAVVGALANIEFVNGTSIIPVNPIEEPEQFSTQSPTSTSYGFFPKGNYVQILPIPGVGVCRLWYFKRTSVLVQTSACAQVTVINGAVVTVASLPSTITTGSYIDGCGDQPPFNLIGENIQISSISGTDLTLASAIPNLSIGDWIALTGQTPVPPIPVEFRVLLAQRVVCKIYELQGYANKLKLARDQLKDYEKDTFGLITPRVKSHAKVIHPVNGGFLSSNRGRRNFPAGANS